MISAFDLFKIGIGPSSSHTMGPMIAARRFREAIVNSIPECTHVQVKLYGSLAWTGVGHGTDRAVCLGLMGETPERVDPDSVAVKVAELSRRREILLRAGRRVCFDPASDIILEKKKRLPGHPNALSFLARRCDGAVVCNDNYYSIGGGFVLREGEIVQQLKLTPPCPFATAKELLAMCETAGGSIADVQRSNERVLRNDSEIDAALDAIRDAMFASINRGFQADGVLPGGLSVRRRAHGLRSALLRDEGNNVSRPHETMDWVSAYAIAVNEENAAGGRIVTAPTNGAAGIIPAVLRYYWDFYSDCSEAGARQFLLTAAAIGALIKANASISGAEVGCQGEVGAAASMAAAALTAVSGGTPRHIENAAEIALEHHLGMTCDPVGGLVQVPCIERNAIGAQKAIASAALALRGDGTHRVSLDEAIETMRKTGADMRTKYKETSRGGLATTVADC